MEFMERIKFYSTSGISEPVSFSEALLNGLAPDGGLYMPSYIPRLGENDIAMMSNMEYHEIASVIIACLTGEGGGDGWLSGTARDIYNFPVPVEEAGEERYILRLDRGPTGSFKDFAALMLASLLNRYVSAMKESLLVLTATSGDTGSAVARAFSNKKDTRVVVLFPEKEISELQRRQMTTAGKSVTAVAVKGKFDDCQGMVKRVFSEQPVEGYILTSANSINIGRLIPQVVYYFYAWSRICKPGQEAVFSVPSGNFGDLMGGVIAQRMGLPVRRFIVAVNDNDEFPRFLESGQYNKVDPSRNSISSAMNVGHPSNLARLVDIYGGRMDSTGKIIIRPDLDSMRRDFASYSLDDESTRGIMREVYRRQGILLEPHGAVAWGGLDIYRRANPAEKSIPSFILSTAHPAKFASLVEEETGVKPHAPGTMAPGPDPGPERYITIENNYDDLVGLLKTHDRQNQDD